MPGLPAIVTFSARNHIESPRFPRGEEPECTNSDIIENSFKGKTVGPKPPPQPFVPLEFLNYLITLVHDSRQLGWITQPLPPAPPDGARLLAILTKAKRKLEAAGNKEAKEMLQDFRNQLQAISCLDFACPGNKLLTSKGFALLFFNAQHLWERL